MQNVIIADLDGTIALVEHRRHFVKGKKKNWNAFYQACVRDKPNAPVINILQMMQAGNFMIKIYSGREVSVVKQTVDWLDRYHVPYNSLRMRPLEDTTPDQVLKYNWYKQDELEGQVIFVLDDRQKVVDMWRSIGLTCLQVAPGNF